MYKQKKLLQNVAAVFKHRISISCSLSTLSLWVCNGRVSLKKTSTSYFNIFMNFFLYFLHYKVMNI